MVSTPEPMTAQRQPFAGSLIYLLMNFPLGIFCAVALTTLTVVGLSTSIIWVGVPLLALAILGVRGAGRWERARIAVFLRSDISAQSAALPENNHKARWMARVKDKNTWRNAGYFLALLPVGVIQFGVLALCWAPALALTGLPIYFRFLPEGTYYFPTDTAPWIAIDSTIEALPWAAFGVLLIALAVAVTKALATQHVKFAHFMFAAQRSPHEASVEMAR